MFKWLKKIKLFSISWSFFFFLLAMLLLLWGLNLAGNAFKNEEGKDQWKIIDERSSHELKDYVR
jgi:Na+/phosphate symporter